MNEKASALRQFRRDRASTISDANILDGCADEIDRLTAEVSRLRSELGATPCKRLMLQETPYAECFPFEHCLGCDCWRSACGDVSDELDCEEGGEDIFGLPQKCIRQECQDNGELIVTCIDCGTSYGPVEGAALKSEAHKVVNLLRKVGDETQWQDKSQTDRVFAWYEFDDLRTALGEDVDTASGSPKQQKVDVVLGGKQNLTAMVVEASRRINVHAADSRQGCTHEEDGVSMIADCYYGSGGTYCQGCREFFPATADQSRAEDGQ